jgi:hypothetical protein
VKRSTVGVMVLLLLVCARTWAEDGSLTPQLLRTVQIGTPEGITAEQITAVVKNGHSTYLDMMLARSALVALYRDDPKWESFDNLLSSVLNSALNSGNVYRQPRDLHAGFGGKELVLTMVYALVMSGQQERAVDILEQHLFNGSQVKQAIVLQALRNIGTQRAISLIQKYQEKGDYHNLAENTLADQDMPVLSEVYARWSLVPPEMRDRKNLLQIVQGGCGVREALAAYWLGYFAPSEDPAQERSELSALRRLYENSNPGCDYMGRIIALKSLGLRSPETINYWSNILHIEPDAWLRHQALINAFGHYGRQFAPEALNLLATEPSQYMQWQLMQGNIETRQGQRYRRYWDIWIPVGLQFMLVFPDPGHQGRMSPADQEDLLRWLETGHRPLDRVVFNHMIYNLLPHMRRDNTRRVLTFFNNLPDRNSNWWILMRLEDASALPLLRYYETLPVPENQHQQLLGIISRMERLQAMPQQAATCCEPTQQCLHTLLEKDSPQDVKIASENAARAWLKGSLEPKASYDIAFSGPLDRAATVHRSHGLDEHWEYLYDCWRRTDAVTLQPSKWSQPN